MRVVPKTVTMNKCGLVARRYSEDNTVSVLYNQWCVDRLQRMLGVDTTFDEKSLSW